MSKPESLKIQPWTDFPRQPYSFINDDFVHEKLAVVKVNSKGPTSNVNIKATINTDKTGVSSLSDQVKLWFSLEQNRAVYTRLKSTNYLKVHYDHGTVEAWGKKWNLYGSLNTNKVLQNLSLRVGAHHLSKVCLSDNRLKIDLGGEGKNNVTWYNRTIVNYDNFVFGFVGAYGLVHNVLVRNNFLFGLKLDEKRSISLRVQNDGYRTTRINHLDWRVYFDTVKLDYVVNYSESFKYATEVSLGKKAEVLNEVVLVAQHYESKNKLTSKLSLSGNLKANVNASLLFKLPSPLLKNIGTLSLGFNVSNVLNEKRTFKYGGQLQLNV